MESKISQIEANNKYKNKYLIKTVDYESENNETKFMSVKRPKIRKLEAIDRKKINFKPLKFIQKIGP